MRDWLCHCTGRFPSSSTTQSVLFDPSCIPHERAHTYNVWKAALFDLIFNPNERTHLQSLSCLTQLVIVSQMRGHTPTKSVMFDPTCIPNERTHLQSLSCLTQLVSQMRGHTYKVCHVWPNLYPKWEDTPTKSVMFDPTCIPNERTHLQSLSCLTQLVSQMRGHTYKVCHVWPNLYPKWEDTHLQSRSCLTWAVSQMRGHILTRCILFDPSFIPNERTHTYETCPVCLELYPKREDTHLRNLSCLSWVVSQMRGHIPTKYILFDPSFILNERTHTYKVWKYVMFDSWTVEV